MAFTWVDSEAVEVPIQWTLQESEVEVNAGKELIRITFRVFTDGAECAFYVDRLELRFDLERELIEGDRVSYIWLPGAPAGNVEFPVWGATRDVEITGAFLVPKAEIVGSDSDYTQLKLVRNDTSVTICTKTFLSGTTAPAYTVTQFGPVSNGELPFGVGIKLVKEDFGNGMVLPELVVVITWNLR